MNWRKLCTMAVVGTSLTVTAMAQTPSAADTGGGPRILDDFESYTANQVIGESAKSKPWKRFGEATMDNVVATGRENLVLAGKRSAQYPVGWPARFGMVRFVPDAPTDLTKGSSIKVKLRSSNPDTRTKAHLSITNGKATCESKQAVELTDKVQEFEFSLSPEGFEHVDGDRDHTPELVLGGATEIGFKLVSSPGQEYKETILIDDVTVETGGQR